MTVTAANETARTGYTATGGETTFDYTFEIAASGDLAVERNGVVLPTSHYSVAGAGTEDGGTITLSGTYYPSGATADDTWVLYRNMSLTRAADYQVAGDFRAATVNADFDRLWQAMQQLARQNLYSLAFPISDTLATGDNNIPATADRASMFLAFDAAGLPIAAAGASSSLTPVSAYMDTLLDDTTAAAARTTLGVEDASDTVAGIVELATTAETTTGTDATRAVTPDGLHDMTSLAGAAWFLDEDAMGSDSATKTASQQSIKAYVDTSIAAIGGVTAGTILQTANLATAATVQAHGLGATPTLLVAEIECLTAENGYSIGDRVFTAIDRMGPGGATSWGIFADATNVTALCNGNYVNQAHKSTRANANMTMANWKLRVTPLLVS
jgi:hypothetical protein